MTDEMQRDATTGEHIMQALKDIKIGGKLVLDNDDVVTIIHLSRSQIVSQGDAGYYLNSSINGKSTELSEFDIKAKHDPRWWLKDLPDASIFNSEVEYLEYDPRKGWFCYIAGCGLPTYLDCLKTPKLAIDETNLSRITLLNLKTWQEQSKNV